MHVTAVKAAVVALDDGRLEVGVLGRPEVIWPSYKVRTVTSFMRTLPGSLPPLKPQASAPWTEKVEVRATRRRRAGRRSFILEITLDVGVGIASC